MADLTVVSYDLNGKKLSFADWISNLSPTETPFISMTGKESVSQTLFQWQTDKLAQASELNANVEGSEAESNALVPTLKHSNITQILRKVVMVSDTATTLANYGRKNETKYQLEKVGKEIKRDLEVILLSDQTRIDGDAISIPRRTAAFRELVAPYGIPDTDTGAVVHKAMAGANPTEAEIFDMTYNLYLSGSDADIIMFHPTFATFFASLMEVSQNNGRVKLFSGDDLRYSQYVTEIVDPLGRTYKLVPNRWMPQDAIYFLNAKNWTQMVLREPERSILAKDGSYTKWLLEMEVGLRHKHPYASGVLLINGAQPEVPVSSIDFELSDYFGGVGNVLQMGASDTSAAVTATLTLANVNVLPSSAPQGFTVETADPLVATVAVVNGKVQITAVGAGTTTITVKSTSDVTKTGTANITVYSRSVSTSSFTKNPSFIGDTQTLSYSIDTPTPAPTWTFASLNTGVAAVDSSALVTSVGNGFTNVRAIASVDGVRFFDQSSIDVDPIVFDVVPNAVSVAVTETINISGNVSCTPASAAAQGYSYSVTSGGTFASVNPSGVISGIAEGSATVRVSLVAKPTVFKDVVVTVTPAGATPVASIALNSANYYGGVGSRVLQMGAADTSDAVSATITPSTVTILPADAPQGYSATSSAPGVATVEISGNTVNITAISAGTSTLTVTSTADGTKTATATITVYDRTVSTDSYSPSTILVGETSKLVYEIDVATPAPTWSFATLNTAVATINGTGLTTGTGDGFTRGRAIASVNGVRFYDQSGITVNAAI
ncbi:hypothetical protein [Lundtoftevirus Lu221]|uniref:BIG2 domain-containing protein n=1 Tax=phage PKM.Lu.22.1 TaxID=3049197 RepID=A0AAF0RCY3_9CAUD|nr:hypothetical protein [phage PKM.Lu.22.1]